MTLKIETVILFISSLQITNVPFSSSIVWHRRRYILRHCHCLLYHVVIQWIQVKLNFRSLYEKTSLLIRDKYSFLPNAENSNYDD